MSKCITTIYVDRDILDRAKLQNINISKFIENTLRIRLNIVEKPDENEPLNKQIAKAEVELSESQRKLTMLQNRQKDIETEEKKEILERRVIDL